MRFVANQHAFSSILMNGVTLKGFVFGQVAGNRKVSLQEALQSRSHVVQVQQESVMPIYGVQLIISHMIIT